MTWQIHETDTRDKQALTSRIGPEVLDGCVRVEHALSVGERISHGYSYEKKELFTEEILCHVLR